MEFENFQKTFLSELNFQQEQCIYTMEKNAKVIERYLSDKTDSTYLNQFILGFNNILVSSKVFDLYEKVLYHRLFCTVYEKFRESDVLIRACRCENKNAIKWLLTMDINPSVSDDMGKTALMYASTKPDLLFVVKYLLSKDDGSKFLLDNNGENALFYAVRNDTIFKELLNAGLDINQLNKNYDSVFTYCCRNKIYDSIRTIISNVNVDPNIFNNEEKTGIMYLVEEGKSLEIELLKRKDINLDFTNGKGESALRILIKKYYYYYMKNDIDAISSYYKIIKTFIEKGCSFNVPIDDDGNTPLMFFMMLEDWNTIIYILLKCKDLDLSIPNKYGISCSLLCSKLIRNEHSNQSKIMIDGLMDLFSHHRTFDMYYRDQNGNNIMLYYMLYNQEDGFLRLLDLNNNFICQINDKKEYPLIVATKLRRRNIVKYLVRKRADVNRQDEFGNTPLHYAVEIGDKYLADLLCFYHCDIDIKNNEGKSPVDLAIESSDIEMMKLLKKPILPDEILKEEENKELIIDKYIGIKRKYEDYYFSSINLIQPNYKPTDSDEFSKKSQNAARYIYKVVTDEGYVCAPYSLFVDTPTMIRVIKDEINAMKNAALTTFLLMLI